MVNSKPFLCIVLSLLLNVLQAQNDCISSPDAFGEYIGKLFLKRKDIKKEPFYTNEINLNWDLLTNVGDKHGVKSPSFKYYKTYFLTGNFELHTYILYLTFRSEKETIAIKLEANKSNNLWSITKIHTAFYELTNPRENLERFIPNHWILVEDMRYPILNEIKAVTMPSGNNAICYQLPNQFLHKYADDLFSFTTPDNMTSIVDFKVYKDIYISSMLSLLNKIKTTNLNEDDIKEINMMKEYLAKPQDFFQARFINSINRISSHLKDNQFSKNDIDNIEFVIKNYDNDVLNCLYLEGDIILKKGDVKEGIRCIAIWDDNAWKIIYQQAHTYSIQDANAD